MHIEEYKTDIYKERRCEVGRGDGPVELGTEAEVCGFETYLCQFSLSDLFPLFIFFPMYLC